MTRRSAVFFLEAGRRDGWGHLSRSWAVARACLAFSSVVPELWVRSDRPAAVRRFLAARRWIGRIRNWPLRASGAAIARSICSVAPAWLWVDSYRIGGALADGISGSVPRVEIRDSPSRSSATPDLLILPYPGPARRTSNVLEGAKYLPLDPGMARLRKTPARWPPRHVLVTFGGGPFREYEEEIRTLLRHDGWFVLIPGGDARSLRPVLARADLVITHAGVTSLETAAAARPMVLLALADNQMRNARGLARGGAALFAGSRIEPSRIRRAARILRDRPEVFHTLVRRGARLVDGRGAERIAREIFRRFVA